MDLLRTRSIMSTVLEDFKKLVILNYNSNCRGYKIDTESLQISWDKVYYKGEVKHISVDITNECNDMVCQICEFIAAVEGIQYSTLTIIR